MGISKQDPVIKNALSDFDVRIEKMHSDFTKFSREDTHRMPQWEMLESDLLNFSRKKILDSQLARQMDRILYKFQTRKQIWLKWIDERHRRG